MGCAGEPGTTDPGETGILEESEAMAKSGDTVKIHYTGTLADGAIFDTSIGKEPLEFTLGEGAVIPGFEEAVTGMQVGDSKTVDIPADQAYGPRDDNLLIKVERSELPEGLEPEVGQQLQSVSPDGGIVVVTVVEVTDTTITVDANHPLAGKDLTFEIELVEIM
ncbi:MAG: peptidylprolyl isomerase [Chloroflexi bacterium]|nr:peptidylprolyl isomerase [Chloroflexota bacterium]